jgi:methylated-DNA-protein-cysteine methyltransferase-like protein
MIVKAKTTMAGYYDLVYEIVAQIPAGRVASYGQIARLQPVPRGARGVGWALAQLSEQQARLIPWWRVVSAQGRIIHPFAGELQQSLLIEEGIEFDENDRIDLQRFGWQP